MWPQKWKASASPGFTTLATALAAVAARSASPVRASSPRREVRPASAVVQSRMGGLQRALDRRAHHALELGEPVERALGQDGPLARVERDRVWAAGHGGLLPCLGVALLVEG